MRVAKFNSLVVTGTCHGLFTRFVALSVPEIGKVVWDDNDTYGLLKVIGIVPSYRAHSVILP